MVRNNIPLTHVQLAHKDTQALLCKGTFASKERGKEDNVLPCPLTPSPILGSKLSFSLVFLLLPQF